MNRKIAIIGLMLILGIIAISGCLQAIEPKGTNDCEVLGGTMVDGKCIPPAEGAQADDSSGIPTPPSPEGEGDDSGIPNVPI